MLRQGWRDIREWGLGDERERVSLALCWACLRKWEDGGFGRRESWMRYWRVEWLLG